MAALSTDQSDPLRRQPRQRSAQRLRQVTSADPARLTMLQAMRADALAWVADLERRIEALEV